MGKVIIQEETTKNPLQLMGVEAAICWNGNINDIEKNIKRGLDCIDSDHGRVMEYPQVYMILDGYSARVIREFYTHIGGSPSRLQSSTRYIDYESGFEYITPPSIERNSAAQITYDATMNMILAGLENLDRLGIPREDCGMLLPLGMATKVVVRTNLRNLVDMSHQRMCTRAIWEYRELFKDISDALRHYSNEWDIIVGKYFKPKCELYGYCPEKNGCGKQSKKEIKESIKEKES